MPQKSVMTDDEIRKQLKKASSMLAELTTIVDTLQGQLDERAAAKIAKPEPVQATPAASPQILAAKDRFGFLMPNSLTGNFNSANNIIEVHAYPNYLDKNVRSKDLADFRSVLAALASAPARQTNRNAIFPVDLENHIVSDQRPKTETERRALDVVEGKSAVGFNVVVLRARTEDNKPVNLYVIEDLERQAMIVAGPGKISSNLKEKLAKGGVSYVVKSEPESVTAINEFLAQGAKDRGNKGKLMMGSVVSVIEQIKRGIDKLVPLSENKLDEKNPLARGYTIGNAIHQAIDEPAVYTQITRAPAI
jgi:hypothetical protein